jgi:hypothetical protein
VDGATQTRTRSTKETNWKWRNYLGELSLAEFRLFTHFVCLEAGEKFSGPALPFFTVSSLSYTTNGFALLKPFIPNLITAVRSLPLCASWLKPDPNIALSILLLFSF